MAQTRTSHRARESTVRVSVLDELHADGTIGQFIPPSRISEATPQSVLELAADHLLLAHGLIAADDGYEFLARFGRRWRARAWR